MCRLGKVDWLVKITSSGELAGSNPVLAQTTPRFQSNLAFQQFYQVVNFRVLLSQQIAYDNLFSKIYYPILHKINKNL